MMKAALSFAFGGLVVLVPQGAKVQEKKPSKVEIEIVEVQDMAEPEMVEEEVVLDEVGENPLAGIMLAEIQDKPGKRMSVRELKSVARLLDRLHTMQVEVLKLNDARASLNRSLGDLKQEADRRHKQDPAHSQFDWKRKLASLESERTEMTSMRDRLQAQISSTQRSLVQVQTRETILANQRKAEAAIRRNAEKAAQDIRRNEEKTVLEVRRNAKRAMGRVQNRNVDEWVEEREAKNSQYVELSRLKTVLKAKAAALEAYKAARVQLQWSQKRGPSVNRAEQIAKLEREIVRLTRELAALKMSSSRSTVGRVPAPGPTSPRSTGVWTTQSPRGSRSSRAAQNLIRSIQSGGRATSGGSYTRRAAPSILGAEGKVIWNELQGIRGEIRALRKLLEAHMKSGAGKSRTGSVGRSGSGRARSGVTRSRNRYLRLPVGKELMGADGQKFTVTKAMTLYLEDGQVRAISAPDHSESPFGLTEMPASISLPYLRLAPTPPKAKAPRGKAWSSRPQWNFAPRRAPAAVTPAAPPVPAMPRASKSGAGTLWPTPGVQKGAAGDPHLHKKKGKEKAKTKKRRSSVIYWSGKDVPPAPRTSKDNELRRL